MTLFQRARRLTGIALAVLALLVVLAFAASQTAWFRERLRHLMVRQAASYLNGQLRIDRLDGNLFTGVQLRGVSVRLDGVPVVAAENISLGYSLGSILSGGIVIDDMAITRPVVVLKRDASGWNLGRLVKRRSSEEGQTGPGRALAIRRITIDSGRVVIPDTDLPVSEISGLQARLALAYAPVKLALTIDRLGFEASPANVSLRRLSGKLALEGDDLHLSGIDMVTARSEVRLEGVLSDYASLTPRLNATLRSSRLSLSEFGGIVPALARVDVVPALSLTAEGALDAVAIGLDMRSEAGALSGTMTADISAPARRVKAILDARDLDLAPWLGDPSRRTRITGRLTVDLHVPGPGRSAAHGRFAFDSPETTAFGVRASAIAATGTLDDTTLRFDARGTAYGARVTATGGLPLPVGGRPFNYAVAGNVSDLDLRSLPRSLAVPRLESRITGHYTLKGAPGSIDAAARLRESTLAGASFSDGTTARVIVRGRRLEYSAAGDVSGLDIRRLGAGLQIAALAQERYASSLNGSFDLRATGRTLADLDLAATGRLTDSSLTGIRLPTLAVDVALAGRVLRAGVRGDFARLDPGALGIPRLGGSDLNGSADLTIQVSDLGGEISLEDVAAGGSLKLGPSTIAGLVVDEADVAGTLARRVLTLDRLGASGPAATITASGVLALDEETASDLKYRFDARDLQPIAVAFGVPVAGALTVQGSASGAGAEFSTRGELNGNRLRYGTSVEALTLSTRFTLRVPDLDWARMAAGAETEAAFVRVGGQDIQRLTATTNYEEQQLDFDTTVEAGPRSLAVGGRLLVHDDHQELHLAELTIGTEGMTWSLPAGAEALVQYGGQRLQVDSLVLENGPQRIAIEGAVSLAQAPGSQPVPPIAAAPARVDLRIERLQLADVDRLLLGDNRLSGELNAVASLSGTLEAPTADAEFSVTNGRVREATFESLAGRVDLLGQRLGLDVTLDQGPGQRLTARGAMPFRAPLTQPSVPDRAPDAPHTEAGSDAMDVHVQTTGLNLALVEGLTTAVTDVSGTVEADVHVIGTLADPHLEGHVSITGGAFTPASTGAAYTALEARLRLEPDRVFVEHLQVNDDDGDPLTISGALAVHERSVGEVDVSVTARGFELVDNQLGDVDADLDLRLTGSITQPRVEGELAVNSGRIELDRILTKATAGGVHPIERTPGPVSDAEIAELKRLPQHMAQEEGAATAPVPTTAATAAVPPPTATSGPATTPNAAGGDVPPRPSAAPEPGVSVLDRLAMDVRVRVPDSLVVRGQDLRTGTSGIGLGNLNVTLGGDIRLQKAVNETGGPAVAGNVSVVRGFYEFQGRRFEVVRDSELRFGGFRPMNPTLRVDAERDISGVIARVHLRGSMRRPQLNLTSQPPLDPSDILSLIVFNAPVNDLGSSERTSLTERAGALAAGFVADPLTRSIGRALDLDYFAIRASGARGEPSVGLGEQIGSRLYVRFQQQFGSDQVSQLQFEYRLADFLRLVTSVAEGAQTSRSPTRRVESQAVDLIFEWSY